MDYYELSKAHKIDGIIITIFGIVIILLVGFLIFIFYNDYIDFHRNKIAPSDRIQKKDILVYKDKIIINISNASVSNYKGTGSMKPVLYFGHNGITIKPRNENDIKIGDIITYQIPEIVSCILENNISVCTPIELIVHRVIEIGEDEEGIYYIMKGDNNIFKDRKIRYSQIKSITFAIIF